VTVPHKTLYVPDKDESMWAAAQRVADKTGVSVSRIVSKALQHHLPTVAAELEQRQEEPVVDEWAGLAA